MLMLIHLTLLCQARSFVSEIERVEHEPEMEACRFRLLDQARKIEWFMIDDRAGNLYTFASGGR